MGLNRPRARAGEVKLFSQVVYVVSQERNSADFAAKEKEQTEDLGTDPVTAQARDKTAAPSA